MTMIEVKAAELSGASLDWAMAKVEGWIDDHNSWLYQADLEKIQDGDYRPSTDPGQIAPLIEKHGVAVRRHGDGRWHAMLSQHLGDGENCRWSVNRLGERYGPLSYQVHRVQVRFYGPALGIAVCRAIVAEVLGAMVQVPAESSEPPHDSPVPERVEHITALEDIAAVLRQSPEWGADQLNEIVAILGREGIPVSD